MNKCEHNKPIQKFCMFEHCQCKEPGGCDDCIRKYHNHIGQISFLNEDDIKQILKKFQVQANYRPKSRNLQQCIFNFFTHVKTALSNNLDVVCKNLINEIGYPYLHKIGTLNCYKRLKNKEYRKVTQKELKELWESYKTVEISQVIKEEKKIYYEALGKLQDTIDKMEKNFKDIFDSLNSMASVVKSNISFYDRTYFLKINDIFKQIKKYPVITFPQELQKREKAKTQQLEPSQKKQLLPIEKKQISPTQRKKLTRDVSLDKHVKIENKLKPVIEQKQNKQSPRQKQSQERHRKDKQPEKMQKSAKRSPKYSFQIKPEEVTLKQSVKQEKSMREDKFVKQEKFMVKQERGQTGYSQKQEQINQKKRKIMQLLMNSKTGKKQQSQPQQKTVTMTPMRDKGHSSKLQIGDYLKDTLSPDRLLIAKQFSTPSNILKYSKQQSSLSRASRNRQSFTSKRAKTTYDQQEQPQSQGQTKQGATDTLMSSQTQTQQLFHAKVHIPIEDNKPQEEEFVSEESVHRCIVVPEVDIIAKAILSMHVEDCQSPLLIKKKEIENFSALMKLAESKIIEEEDPGDSLKRSGIQIDNKSFVKINRIMEEEDAKVEHKIIESGQSPVEKLKQSPQKLPTHDKPPSPQKPTLTVRVQSKSFQKNGQQQPSPSATCVNQSQQMSLALLLKSLKQPGPQAITYLQKSLQYSTNNLSAAQYLSYLYLQADKPQQCLKLCNDILKLISSSQSNDLALRLNINKSAALNSLGRYSECITFLQRCLRYRHNDILYKNLADAYYSVGILQKAIYNYEHSIIQNSANTQAHYNLAVCHYQQENYHNASIYVDKALKHQPTNQIYKEMKKHVDEKIMTNAL